MRSSLSRILISALLLLGAFSFISLSGTSFAAWVEERVSPNNTFNAYYPAVAVDASKNVHVLWKDNRSGTDQIYYREFSASTHAWETETLLSSGTAGCADATLAIGGSTIYAAWTQNGSIHYKKYSGSWGSESTLSGPQSPTHLRIASDPSANLYFVWVDTRGIYYQKNTPTTQGSPLPVTDGGAVSANNPSIAVDGSGNVHIVWVDHRAANGEIFYKTFNGTPSGSDVQVSYSSDGSLYPSIAADPSGNATVVWQDFSASEIYYRYRALNGYWSNSNMLSSNDGHFSWQPSIAYGGGKFHVVWQDFRSLQWDDIYYINGTGTSWNGETCVTTHTTDFASSTFPSIAADSSGNPHIVWEDTKDGNYINHIYYGTLGGTISGTLHGPTGLSLSGLNVGISGISAGTAVTDGSGTYSMFVKNGTYTITPPSLGAGYDVAPLNYSGPTAAVVTGSDVSGKDFTYTVHPPDPTYTISGTVTGPNGGIKDVNIYIGSGINKTYETRTLSDGTYTTGAHVNGTYQISVPATIGNLTCATPAKNVTINGGPVSGINFTYAPPPPSLNVSPLEWDLTAAQGGASTSETITISIGNGQPGTNYTWNAAKLTTDALWLTLSPTGGTISGAGSASLTLNVDPHTLAVGSYTATVEVTSTATGITGSPKHITVKLNVSSLSITPASMFFQAQLRAANPASQNLTIVKSGTGSASWTISAQGGFPSWLTVTPTIGATSPGTPSTVAVSVSRGTLAAGDYYANLSVVSAGNPNTTIRVHMNIHDALYLESVSPDKGPTGIWIDIQGNTKLTGATRIEFIDGSNKHTQATTNYVNGSLKVRVPYELKAGQYDIKAINSDENYTKTPGYTVVDAPDHGQPYARPNPFDPKNGTIITFSLDNNVTAKLLVYSSTGKLVWQDDGIVGDGTQQNIPFDGMDGFGRYLSNGPYYIFVVADGKVIAKGEMCAFTSP